MENLIDTQINGLKNHKIFDVEAGGFRVVTTDYNFTPAKVTKQSAVSYDAAFLITQ